ncbi:NADH:flavin oxidoreductase/NADH oxidase [Suillus discolor]|uniref:NADH:flavin oxidoreductase/NADH oxidase n=1 Tax=Suillus discolor TaxID=1912936 RepID=A0A9P7EYB8_9AGAM|nr:NADH:flavin oxidoreductase/NADH oxidase [Suillus discolor]KAG2095890.1 NADH:flavin oxidoreductase/NADH oxidase [Suillus discolor]
MSDSSTSALFSPIRVGNISLQHRVVLSPLTRKRAHADHVPSPQAPAYYSQRGSTPGTLLITEATFISQRAGGYDNVPGIYTDAHLEGWKKVTEAVHEKGSFIFLQLWALGRTAETAVLAKEDNSPLVSASPISVPGETDVPRALTTDEIKEYVATYTTAAKNAIRAGFDGVEIHCANGYLIDQFVQDVSNQRTDQYGGSIENRARFALEVTDAVVEAIGAERTGFRMSPWGVLNGMGMADPKPQFSYLVKQLRKHKLAYIHVVEPMPAEVTAEKNSDFLRDIWQGVEGSTFISTNGYTRNTAIETVDKKGGPYWIREVVYAEPRSSIPPAKGYRA